jgi:hypothetical protein
MFLQNMKWYEQKTFYFLEMIRCEILFHFAKSQFCFSKCQQGIDDRIVRHWAKSGVQQDSGPKSQWGKGAVRCWVVLQLVSFSIWQCSSETFEQWGCGMLGLSWRGQWGSRTVRQWGWERGTILIEALGQWSFGSSEAVEQWGSSAVVQCGRRAGQHWSSDAVGQFS